MPGIITHKIVNMIIIILLSVLLTQKDGVRYCEEFFCAPRLTTNAVSEDRFDVYNTVSPNLLVLGPPTLPHIF